jgi:hypothetical protein
MGVLAERENAKVESMEDSGRGETLRMKSDGVAVLPSDGEGRTTVVGQNRYMLGEFSWDVPGDGRLIDQAALEAAQTE